MKWENMGGNVFKLTMYKTENVLCMVCHFLRLHELTHQATPINLIKQHMHVLIKSSANVAKLLTIVKLQNTITLKYTHLCQLKLVLSLTLICCVMMVNIHSWPSEVSVHRASELPLTQILEIITTQNVLCLSLYFLYWNRYIHFPTALV